MLFFKFHPEWRHRQTFGVLKISRVEIAPAIAYFTWVMDEFRSDSQYPRIRFKVCVCHWVEYTFASCNFKSLDLHPAAETVRCVGEFYADLIAVLHPDASYCFRTVTCNAAESVARRSPTSFCLIGWMLSISNGSTRSLVTTIPQLGIAAAASC